MGLSDSGTHTSWACYLAPVGSTTAVSGSAARGITTLDGAQWLTVTPIPLGSYVGGVMRAAVFDEVNAFYVSAGAACVAYAAFRD